MQLMHAHYKLTNERDNVRDAIEEDKRVERNAYACPAFNTLFGSELLRLEKHWQSQCVILHRKTNTAQ